MGVLGVVELGEGNGSSNNSCPDGVPWMLNVFGTCVENATQLAGFWIGLISLVLWLFPIISQLVENYRRKSTEALSIYFLLFWFCGDLANVVGAILTSQLEIQIFIGFYYILQDMALFSQFLYYTGRERYLRRIATDAGSVNQAMGCLFVFSALSTFAAYMPFPTASLPFPSSRISAPEAGPVVGRKLLHYHFFNGAKDEVGYAIGSVSAISYFCGRVPQLIKNHRRGTTDGVSILMFIIIVLGNLTYGLSVLLSGYGYGWDFVLHHAPWLAGSLGCCFLDFFVILQALYFDHWHRSTDDETSSLLPPIA